MKVLLPKSIFIIPLIIILSVYSGFAQPNKDGFPIITNYDLKDYMAEEANWSIAKDNRGVMYFGNEKAVLEYDGTTWRKILVPGQQYIYSLTIGPDSSIYVGGVDDFGHLVVDKSGKKTYKSLAYLLTDTIKIQRIWRTYADSSNIYFCATREIFKYHIKSQKIDVIEFHSKFTFFTYQVGNQLYVSDYERGLLKLTGDKLELVSDSRLFINKDIFEVLPWSKDTLLVASKQAGLSLLNPSTGIARNFAKDKKSLALNNSLKDASIYTGIQLDKNRYAFGTINNGIYIIDKQSNVLNHLNESNGMQSKVVTNLFYAGREKGILWASLASGISAINIDSPVRYFSSESGLDGALYGISEHENKLYVSSYEGVYKMRGAAEGVVFEHLKDYPNEITYALINFKGPDEKEILLAGSVKGLFSIDNGKVHKFDFVEEINRIVQSKVDPSKIYIGTGKGLLFAEYKNGKITVDKDNFRGLENKYVSHIVEDKNGDLWYNTLSENVFLSKNGEVKELPETIKDKDGIFFGISGMVYFGSKHQIYRYNYEKRDFEPYGPLQQLFEVSKKSLKKYFTLSDSSGIAYYGVGNESYAELIRHTERGWEIDSTAYRLIPSMSFSSAYENDNFVMLGGQEGLYKIDKRRNRNNTKYKTLIRQIVLGTDSIFYNGGDGYFKESITDKSYILFANEPIEYRYNNIAFSYSAVFFEKEQDIVYSSYLEGFDKKWLPWTNDISRSYTNLKEGTYRFKVKAKNIYGVTSKTAVFVFEILPPWYRTWWAYSLYLLIAFIIIRIAISMYTRKLQEDKKRLEKIVEERTAEIIEKNHRIEKQNIAITDSIKYAQRIQNAVLPDKQTSGLFEYFIYFKPKDIVSGDFYWVSNLEKQNRLVVVAADCTGHGVPGAFMSMLGTSFLNEIVAKLDVVHSEDVLNLLRENVIRTLNQGAKGKEEERQKDGMDMALASIDLETLTLEYSGANNPLVLIRDDELVEYKPDKMPIGAYVKQDITFTRKEIELKKHDVFYLFSDGYVDQFGGPSGRKYMKKRFKEFLFAIHKRPMFEQRQLLSEEMLKWMDGQEQIDDQIVIGMRLIN